MGRHNDGRVEGPCRFFTYVEANQPIQYEDIEVFARFIPLTMSDPGEKESCVT